MFGESIEKENDKQKEQMQYLVIMLLAGIGYYLFFFLPEQRNEAKKEIKAIPSFEKEIKKFYKRINSASENDISSIIDEANVFITQQKNKRQRLHWLREPKN